MSTVTYFQKRIVQMMKLKEYDRAMDMIITAKKYFPYAATILLLESDLLQLAGKSSSIIKKYPFSHLKDILHKAVEYNPDSIAALIELGYYYNVHEDNQEKAKFYFQKALNEVKKFRNDIDKALASLQ